MNGSAFRFRPGIRTTRSSTAPVCRADRLPLAEAGAATLSASACTASVRPRTSSARSLVAQGRRVFAFTRPGEESTPSFAVDRSARSGRATRAGRRPEPRRCGVTFARGRARADGAGRDSSEVAAVVGAGIHIAAFDRARTRVGEQAERDPVDRDDLARSTTAGAPSPLASLTGPRSPQTDSFELRARGRAWSPLRRR